MIFQFLFQKPSYTKNSLLVWQRNFLFFQKFWTVSLFWTVIEPLMYLGAIGFGLGSFVNNVSGYSYLEFFFPGLLCSTAMMVPYFECTYSHYSKLSYQKLFTTMLMTPLSPDDIAGGEILWGATKGVFSIFGVLIVASFFGLVSSWKIIPAFFILLLVSLLFSSLGIIISTYALNFDSFVYSTSGFIVPMSLFAGTYFPIDTIPTGFRQICYLFPLTHAVSAVRGLMLNQFTYLNGLSVFVLIILTLFLYNFASYRLKYKLNK